VLGRLLYGNRCFARLTNVGYVINPWVFSSAQRGQRTSFQFGRTLRGYCFLLCFSVTGLGPWCIDIALLFDNPVVHGCLFVACLVLFAWGLCTAALLCLVCLIVGGQFRTITCRQIRLAHSSVCQGSHTLAHPSDLRLGKGCKTLLSLSLNSLRVMLIRASASIFWSQQFHITESPTQH